MPNEQPPSKIIISDEQPLLTEQLRDSEEFQIADPTGELPDVTLASGTPNPLDRHHPNALRVGIYDANSEEVGALNLIQKNRRSWVNDVAIKPERQGERLAVATYLGIIAAQRSVGRVLESDPMGLSDHSVRVWESLTRRGVAQQLENVDRHGHPRFVSQPPLIRQ